MLPLRECLSLHNQPPHHVVPLASRLVMHYLGGEQLGARAFFTTSGQKGSAQKRENPYQSGGKYGLAGKRCRKVQEKVSD